MEKRALIPASAEHQRDFPLAFRLKAEFASDPVAVMAFEHATKYALYPDEMEYIAAVTEPVAKLPVTEAEFAAAPRSTYLPPDEEDLRIASTYALRRCPFCNSRSAMGSAKYNPGSLLYQYRIECPECWGSIFYNAKTREEARTQAIKRWTERPSPLPEKGGPDAAAT